MKNLQYPGKRPEMNPQVPLEKRGEQQVRQVQEEAEDAMTHQPRETTTVSHIATESYTAAVADAAATILHHPEEEDQEGTNLGL